MRGKPTPTTKLAKHKAQKFDEFKDIDNIVAQEQEIKSTLKEWWYPEKEDIDKPEILERRRKVAVCWNRRGMSCIETARELGVSPATISKDRHWLLGCWQNMVQSDIIEIVSRELSKLEAQEAELWAAWERSKEDICTTVREKHVNEEGEQVGGEVVRTTTTGRLPESKYMENILRCQERRSKLLGLDKAVTFEGAAFEFAGFVESAFQAAKDQRERMKAIDVTPPPPLELYEPEEGEEDES